MALFYFITILVFACVFGISFYFAARGFARQQRENLEKIELLSIRVPHASDDAADVKTQIRKFEDFLKRLASFHSLCALEAFVENVGDEVHFHVSAPREFVSSVREEVYLLWRGARVEIVHGDPGILRSGGVSIGGYIIQKKDHLFSVKTHRILETNPFGAILEAFLKVNKIGEGAGIQIVIRPVSERHKKDIARSLASMTRGELGEIVPRRKLFSSKGIDVPSLSSEINEKKEREKIRKDIFNFARRKLSGPIFKANVRICVSAGTKFRAEEILREIAAGFTHFDDPYHNEFKFVKPRNAEAIIGNFSARSMSDAETVVLSSEEIASFFHFPAFGEKSSRPGLFRSKQAPPPAGASSKGILIGDNEFEGKITSIFMDESPNQNRHAYIIGDESTGKSTLLGNMILEDIAQGRGVALVDPKGKLAESLLGKISSNRVKDVVYLKMTDAHRLPGIDALRPGRGGADEQKIRMASELASIVKKFFPLETIGPMFDEYIKNAIALLSEDASANTNILDVPRVFVDKKYRAALLSKSKNKELIRFWEHDTKGSLGDAALENIAPSVFWRFKKFVSSEYLRGIFEDPRTAVGIENIVAEGKILFVGLNEDDLGKPNSEFLGMIIINNIIAATQSGAQKARGNRMGNFCLYIDDCGGYIPDSVARAMSEGKDYSINLSVVARSVGDIAAKTREAIFKSPVSKIAFRVRPGDAEVLASEFNPQFSAHDLMNAEDLNACAKIAIRGEIYPPVSLRIKTDSWAVGNLKTARDIQMHSRSVYGRDAKKLESKTRMRTSEHLPEPLVSHEYKESSKPNTGRSRGGHY